jgi:prevent-host-death family protein
MESSMHEARMHFSRLLEKVALGEEVIITKAGKPVAKLVAIGKGGLSRKLGSAKGEFVVPKDFNARLPKRIKRNFWK